MRALRVLFILKDGSPYGEVSPYSYSYLSSGLLYSAEFVVEMLEKHGVVAKLVEVQDNNSIDRVVKEFNPDVVVIEALWVVPSKFKELSRLHPHVKWVVRMHSDWPFLSSEGIAVGWLFEYVRMHHVYVGFNSSNIVRDFKSLVNNEFKRKILSLPDYFPLPSFCKVLWFQSPHCIRIGCFGAIRPLKNQLIQAVAAMKYAESRNQSLEFHINGTVIEQGGESILKNLRSLFEYTSHRLIEHPWMTRNHFLDVISQMDFVMAVSLSETFCITAADAAQQNISLVCSPEVPWASQGSIVNEVTSADAIVRKLKQHKKWGTNILNRLGLWRYAQHSAKVWMAEIRRGLK